MLMPCRLICFGLAALVLAPRVASSQPISISTVNVTLSPSLASPQPIGTTIRWTATATDSLPGRIVFRFEVRPVGVAEFRVLRDFHANSVMDWAFYEREVNLEFRVTARNQTTAESASTIVPFTYTPRVVGPDPVINTTPHRLVFLYSAPPCPVGSYMRARFKAQNPGPPTLWKPCVAGVTMNFLIAGVRANTNYQAYYELATGTTITPGPLVPFTTPALPESVTFPTSSALVGPDANSCLTETIILHGNLAAGPTQSNMPVATDIYGRVIWYYIAPVPGEQRGSFILRPLRGGTMLHTPPDVSDPGRPNQFLREIDLVGNTVRETNVERVNEQLISMSQDPISGFHHEATRLPNGNIVALTYIERLMTDVQGPGTVDVLADGIVELDRNLQVVWVWNAFDHLDVTRKALLNETCIPAQGGCPDILTKGSIANDWTHANALGYTPDGHLLLSMRHQDWVIKINFANGTGAGDVLWRLGKDGDFSITSSDPYPWFSHQHDAEFDAPGQALLSIYDNGNVRRTLDPSANSRGQVFLINEAQLSVELVLNADLGVYAFAVGSAERLCNGNYFFNSGIIMPTNKAQSTEVLPDGTINYTLETPNAAYRTFRMMSLFHP